MTASCIRCASVSLEATVAPPRSPEALYLLLAKSDMAKQQMILYILGTYVDGVLQGSARSINAHNQKFSSFIGTDSLGYVFARDASSVCSLFKYIVLTLWVTSRSIAIMASIGFTYIESRFEPPQPMLVDRSRLEMLSTELSLRSFLLNTTSNKDQAQRHTFTPATQQLCRILGVQASGDSSYLEKFVKRFNEQSIEYSRIGASSLFSIEISDLSDSQLRDIYISVSDTDPRRQPTYFAYSALGAAHLREAPDTAIIEQFTEMDLDQHRQALRTVGVHRSSNAIEYFLMTGESVSGPNGTMTPISGSEFLPAGLANVGNTCYLNSLLQLYFSIVDLRHRIFQFVPPLPDGLSAREQQACESLTSQFTSNTFGIQQDISECMDNIIDMLDLAFNKLDRNTDGLNKLIQKLFVGTIHQTLRYNDSDGTQRTSTKEETFHQLIVDPADDLMKAVDSYFVDQKRVKYDRETNTAIKSNQFVAFPKVMSLARYSKQTFDPSQTSKLDSASTPDNTTLYQLFAVLVHEGEASFGHYWISLFDGQQTSDAQSSGRWIKLNDSVAQEVQESQILADTTGSSANAYALVYVRACDFDRLVRPFARDAASRFEMQALFPELAFTDTPAYGAAAAMLALGEQHQTTVGSGGMAR
eukprot:jgi/Hompol1/4516/HPOL_003683-RA